MQCTVIVWIFMMIQFKTIVRDCQFDICFQFVCVIFLFKNKTPGGEGDASRGKVRSLKSVPSEQLRTRRKKSTSDHSGDQRKNYSRELGDCTNLSQKD